MSIHSHTASNNATMCDVLTRCTRPSHYFRLMHHQACAPSVPSVTFLIHASLRRGRACHRDLAFCQLLHRTGHRQMRSAPTFPLCSPRGSPFHGPEGRAPASFIVRVAPTSPKGLPNRHRPSLTDRGCLFLRAVILWVVLSTRTGMPARPANATAHQPPRHARCTQPRLFTYRTCRHAAKHFPNSESP